ncbi:MAG: helix-turn-helix transcriptional regulator [Peptococcaceae bacterium]
MEVGKRIAEIRKENRMSQEQFGQLFHVTRQTVSNWEMQKVIRICKHW